MEVSVTQKELEAIEKLENMQISFLEFDSSQNCFAKEVSVDDDDSTVPSMTHSDHCDPQHSQQIYEFCGPNKHQSLLSAQVLLDGRWKDIKMTVDSGSECSAISSATLDEMSPQWRNQLKRKPGCTLSGPAGEPLTNLGTLPLKMSICDQILKLDASVLQSSEKTMLLGSPQIEELKLGLIPGRGVFRIHKLTKQTLSGVGCDPSLRKFTGDQESTVEIGGILPSRESLEDADSKIGFLPPCGAQVKISQSFTVEPWGCQRVAFKPCLPEILENYHLQNFLFRPCLCILDRKECETCLMNPQNDQFQLCRYINGEFKVSFVNNRMSSLEVPADYEACVEYCREVLTVEEVARELLEVLEVEKPLPIFSSQEAREQFDLSYEELKGKLSQVICEPMSFSARAMHEPTLAIYPVPEGPKYSTQGLTMEEYSQSNPCKHCLSLKKIMCDPLLQHCVTSKLYEPQLREIPESELMDSGCYSWDSIGNDYKEPQLMIWGVRPGLKNLKDHLATFFHYEKHGCILQTEKANVLAIVWELSHRRVIFDSTEALKQVYGQCIKHKISQIHFPNVEVWGISQHRISRIFGDKYMKIKVYNAPSHLATMVAWNRADGESKDQGNKVPGQMPPTESVVINPGCPPTIGNPELDAVREKPVLKETILCCDPEIEKKTKSLLDSYPSLWASDAYGCGSFRDKETQKIIRFDIKFAELQPIVDKPRWNSPAKREAIKELLGGLLRQGIIAPAYSRWRHCPVFVQKKVENISRSEWIKRGHPAEKWSPGLPDPLKKPKLRLTVDIKNLNSLMTELPMTPSDPRELVAALQDNNIISTLDCSLAFNSLHLSRAASSTMTHYGGLPDGCTYSHQRASMGGRQSSCLLAAALQYTLQPCQEYVFQIADDCIVLARNEEDMLIKLSNVFRNLSQAGFRLKRNKLSLYIGSRTPTINLFGLTLNLKTRQVYPIQAQTKEVSSRCLPTTVTQMKSLLGVLAWWHTFLPGHQKHNQVLHQMVHKNAKIEWTEQRLQSLEWVLDMLVSPACHNFLPHPMLPFHLAVDGSQYYAGLFLWQQPEGERPRVVGYHAKIFSAREAKCCSWEREALSGIYGIHTFWRYISGRPTTMYVDSKTSVFVSDYSHSNSKISRYRIFLEGLDWLRVKWVPGGGKNINQISIPDFLSRRSELPRSWKNKQVSKADENQIEKISSKLALHFTYSVKSSLFLLDYLMDLSENQIQSLPDYSLRMNDSGQIECDLLQSVDHPHQIDLLEKKIQREKAEKSKQDKSEKEEKQIPEPVGDKSEGIGGHIQTPGEMPLQKVFKLKIRSWEDSSKIDKRWGINKVKVGTEIENAMAPQSLTFDELEAIYRPNICAFHPPKETVLPKGKCDGDRFLYGVQSHSPGLDYTHLSKMQYQDPRFQEIIDRCRGAKGEKWEAGQRITYFLAGKEKVLCRTVKDKRGEKRFQLVIPIMYSYDICMVAHRSTRGAAIEGTGAATHFGPAKLARLLSHKLYIPRLSYILTQITQTCQVCLECRRVKRNKPSYFRQLMKVNLPGMGYYLDELQVASNDCLWGFKKLLVAVCAFSHYCICIPIKKQLSQQYLVELLHLNIFMPYGRCSFLVTDQASVLCGNIIQQSCTLLNISLNTTPRYSPAANISELLNSQILKYLRIQKENHDLTPGTWCLALAASLNLLNFSPYAGGDPSITPAVMFFGSRFGVAQNVQPGLYQDALVEMFDSPDLLAVETRKAWERIQRIHDDRIKRAKEKEPSGPNAGRMPSFFPGDLVICKFRARPNLNFDYKLVRRSKFLFTVVHSTENTTWIRPHNLPSLQRWAKAVDMNRRAGHPNLTLPVFKTQSIDLQKVRSALTLYSSNSRQGHFKEMQVEKPQQDLELEVATPIQPSSEYMQPELEEDILSDYTQFGNDDDGKDYQVEDGMYQQALKRAEDKIKESGAKIYRYNDMGRLEDEEGEEITRGRWGKEDKQEEVDEVEEKEKEVEEEEEARPRPILRRSTRTRRKGMRKLAREELDIGERLANLAGYSLGEKKQIKKIQQEKIKKVSFLEWRSVVYFSTEDPANLMIRTELCPMEYNQSQVSRKFNSPQVQPQTCASIISQLDAQLLPKICNANFNCLRCSCKKCRDGMETIPLCKTHQCDKCVLRPKYNWL